MAGPESVAPSDRTGNAFNAASQAGHNSHEEFCDDAGDASDSGDASDVSDASEASDAGDATDAGDAGKASDASNAGDESDASDGSDAGDAADAGDDADICEYTGCRVPSALNFDSRATQHDFSCIYTVRGYTRSEQLNYNPIATVDDGTCQNRYDGCGQHNAINFDSHA